MCTNTFTIGMQVLTSHVSAEKWSLVITLPGKHMCYTLIDTPNSVHMVRIVELTFVAKFHTPATSVYLSQLLSCVCKKPHLPQVLRVQVKLHSVSPLLFLLVGTNV